MLRKLKTLHKLQPVLTDVNQLKSTFSFTCDASADLLGQSPLYLQVRLSLYLYYVIVHCSHISRDAVFMRPGWQTTNILT